MPLAGTAALTAVAPVDPSPGNVVLIVGATGGGGNCAVQLAAARGARAVANGMRHDEAHLRNLNGAAIPVYAGWLAF